MKLYALRTDTCLRVQNSCTRAVGLWSIEIVGPFSLARKKHWHGADSMRTRGAQHGPSRDSMRTRGAQHGPALLALAALLPLASAQVDCGALEVAHATTSGSTLEGGGGVTATCDAGHLTSCAKAPCPDNFVATCSMGAWGNVGVCAGIPCTGGLTRDNSPTECSGATGDVCEYVCNVFAGGSCEANDCTDGLTLENSTTVCSGVTGDECAFECTAGFRSNFTRHICGADGSFSGGRCVEIVNSGDFPVENAVIKGETFFEGTGVNITCVDGFEMEDGRATELTCLGTGEWDLGGLLRPVCAFVPPAVSAELSLDGVDGAVLVEGSDERADFESSFAVDIAAALGVAPDKIEIRAISGGRRRVLKPGLRFLQDAVSVSVDFEIAAADTSGALAATSSLNEFAAAIEDGSAGSIGGASPGAMTVEFDEFFINCPLQYIRCKGVPSCAADLTVLTRLSTSLCPITRSSRECPPCWALSILPNLPHSSMPSQIDTPADSEHLN
eukprot:SAG22_NODE_417_length_10770_cov_21.649049_4_plen_500_part_00